MPHTPFFEGILAPVRAAPEVGRDKKLSFQLASFLDSPAVTGRTDDDWGIGAGAHRLVRSVRASGGAGLA